MEVVGFAEPPDGAVAGGRYAAIERDGGVEGVVEAFEVRERLPLADVVLLKALQSPVASVVAPYRRILRL